MIEPLAIIKDIFYTEVFFIWYLGNQLKVAGCVFGIRLVLSHPPIHTVNLFRQFTL